MCKSIPELLAFFNIFHTSDNGCCSTPLLGPLADLGGVGWMHHLRLSSSAIDAGLADCAYFDQRDLFRPRDGDMGGRAACDIGAYEAYLWKFMPLLVKPWVRIIKVQ